MAEDEGGDTYPGKKLKKDLWQDRKSVLPFFMMCDMLLISHKEKRNIIIILFSAIQGFSQ